MRYTPKASVILITCCALLLVGLTAPGMYAYFQRNTLYDPELEARYLYGQDDVPDIKGQVIVITEPVKNVQTRAPRTARTVVIPTIIYHSVRPYIPGESAEQDRYDITPELFEQELKYLNEHGYTTIGYNDVLKFFDTGVPLPKKPVLLTFDDGWKNQHTHAFPLLKKYSMRGTFFIFSGAIGSRASFMTWEDIRELHAARMEIQGHSYSHPKLTQVWDLKMLNRELSKSKKIIEDHINEPVTTFAYPFGMHNERIQNEVAKAGYRLARTTHNTNLQTSEFALALGGTLSSDSFDDFIRVLNRE